MNRRNFFLKTGKLSIPFLVGIPAISKLSLLSTCENTEVRMLSQPSLNHFFGYYGVNPWNASKTHLLSMETTFNNRLPRPGEKADIGFIDMKNGHFEKITETVAWNMQQGSMLFWNPQKPNEEFFHNDIVDNKLVSVLVNVKTGGQTVQPYSISGISENGKYAVNLDYGRISRLRKVVSYSGTVDKNPNVPHPDNSGVFVVNLETGKRKLVVSYKRVAGKIAKYRPEIANRHMWIEHAEFNPEGSRLLFLPRTWDDKGKSLVTGMYTVGVDGKEMREVIPYGKNVSHWTWKNNREIVATFNYPNNSKCHVLVTDGKKNFQPLPGLNWDGHCTFSNDGRYMATDNKKDFENFNNFLWLYNPKLKNVTKLATFNMLERRFLTGDTRCDLHPRWSDDNKMICVDAVEPKTGTRQIFVVYTQL